MNREQLKKEFLREVKIKGIAVNEHEQQLFEQFVEKSLNAVADWWLDKLSSSIQEELEKYEDIFKWLLGEKGDFPDLSQKPHYSFRTELRQRLLALSNNKEDKV